MKQPELNAWRPSKERITVENAREFACGNEHEVNELLIHFLSTNPVKFACDKQLNCTCKDNRWC